MSKASKIFVGLVTLIPFIGVPIFLAQLFIFVVHVSQNPDPPPAETLAGIFSFALPLAVTVLTTLALMVFYIVHALNNKTIDSTEKVIWILIFIFIGAIGFPIYWFMRLWNEG